MPLESAIAPRFLNTILIEGVPGSGKSSGVAATLVAMLKANKHDNILKNAWFAHIGENEAKQLAKDLLNLFVKTTITYEYVILSILLHNFIRLL